MLKAKLFKNISIAILLIGIALTMYMVNVEGEPGAIPLFLILLGAGGYGFAWKSSRR